MTKIILLPSAVAIIFGLLLLMAPATIQSIAKVQDKKAPVDRWVLENRKVVGIVVLLLGGIMLYSAFI